MARGAIFVLAAIVALPALAQNRSGGARSDSPRKAIEAANAVFGADFGRGDSKALAAKYTEHGQMFPPNEKIIEGREAIQAYWQAAIDGGIKGVELKTSEVWGLGETVAETGAYSLTGKDGESLDEGKYVVIWQRVDGHWKLHRDCWNSNKPASK